MKANASMSAGILLEIRWHGWIVRLGLSENSNLIVMIENESRKSSEFQSLICKI